jgi:primosomal protein N' (replication factor Y)
MNYYEVSPIGIVGKDFEILTYGFNKKIPVGTIVEIPVGSRKFVGVVLKKVGRPDFEIKEILRILYDQPLPPALLKLHDWISKFYTTHSGTVWQTMLPAGLNKNRRNSVVENTTSIINSDANRTNFVFTVDQTRAIREILAMESGTAILRGVTGSGKTEVYKSLAAEAATRGKSSIILVPEISLTAQLVDDFRRNFDRVLVTHSTMTESERAKIWLDALTSERPTVVIGPRSALFLPLQDLGLIVIDECHEPSYKQERAPRYNALRVAAVLAQSTNSRLVLGSATPLISDFYAAEKLNRPIIEMKKLARSGALKPETTIVDLTKRDIFTSESRIFSKTLLVAMKETLAAKKQILLFHNRRGSASTTLCENCGWMAMCPRCFLPLTLHADKFELRCHICGHREKPPLKCPECGAAEILHKGIGTKKIEEEIRKIFPDKTVRRFDGDTARGEAVQDVFAKLHDGSTDIIIGTQTIAKGLDLPNLRLVGIVQADAGLMLPDFSANERTFQLIAQACGRVGRGQEKTRAIVQTFQPDAPAVQFGATQNYDDFYAMEIKNRARGHFPPFAHLLKLTCQYKSEKAAINAAKKLAASLRTEQSNPSDSETDRIATTTSRLAMASHSNIFILGPAPAFYERSRDLWRWQIVVRSASRAELTEIAEKVPLAKWQVELDPGSLI